jgi:RNA polymerase sigma-70 factor (ECF subfamily)
LVAVEAETIARFRDGDPDAVRAVYREYGRLVYTVALRALGSRELAEDAAQQTFVQAWRAAHSFDPGRELGPWLVTIARRVAIDIHRRERRREHDRLDDAASTEPALIAGPPDIERSYAAWELRRALDDLPAEERELVELNHLQGLTHSEIAERLGVPVGTVKSRSFRAHRRLAARLGHLRESAGREPSEPTRRTDD